MCRLNQSYLQHQSEFETFELMSCNIEETGCTLNHLKWKGNKGTCKRWI